MAHLSELSYLGDVQTAPAVASPWPSEWGASVHRSHHSGLATTATILTRALLCAWPHLGWAEVAPGFLEVSQCPGSVSCPGLGWMGASGSGALELCAL